MAEAYANVMDNALAHEDGSDTLYEELLGNVTLEGVGSAYIYMTDEDGNILYHPQADQDRNTGDEQCDPGGSVRTGIRKCPSK